MNKKQKNFLKFIFIPAMERLSYEIKNNDKDLLMFCLGNRIEISFFIHRDFLQGIVTINFEKKKFFSIGKLYLLNVDEKYRSRLEKCGSIFLYDNDEEFAGVFNCFYDLILRNTKNFLSGDLNSLFDKLNQINTKNEKLDPSADEIGRMIAERELIRFRECDYFHI